MQRDRVEDPYPWTWEIPTAAVCGVVIMAVVGCQLARSLANLVVGGGWAWPPWNKVVTSVVGIVAGDASAGLPTLPHVASPIVLWAFLTLVILAWVAGLVALAMWALRRWGGDRMRGVASVTEAHELLGADRLWRVRHVVRPDLYPARGKARR